MQRSAVPLMLGFVLGPVLEENLRRALLLSRGDPMIFFSRPISLGFMIATALILLAMVLPTFSETAQPDCRLMIPHA